MLKLFPGSYVPKPFISQVREQKSRAHTFDFILANISLAPAMSWALGQVQH